MFSRRLGIFLSLWLADCSSSVKPLWGCWAALQYSSGILFKYFLPPSFPCTFNQILNFNFSDKLLGMSFSFFFHRFTLILTSLFLHSLFLSQVVKRRTLPLYSATLASFSPTKSTKTDSAPSPPTCNEWVQPTPSSATTTAESCQKSLVNVPSTVYYLMRLVLVLESSPRTLPSNHQKAKTRSGSALTFKNSSSSLQSTW